MPSGYLSLVFYHTKSTIHTRTDQLDFIKIKNVLLFKRLLIKWKDQDCEKIFANHICKGLIIRIHKEISNLIRKQPNKINGQKIKQTLHQRWISMWKEDQHYYSLGKIAAREGVRQVRLRYKSKRQTVTNADSHVEKLEPLCTTGGEYRTVQSLWNKIWQFLKKLNTVLRYDHS